MSRFPYRGFQDDEYENSCPDPILFVPDYAHGLDENLKPIEIGQIDVQKLLDSSLDTCLSRILDKFLSPDLPDLGYMTGDAFEDDLLNLVDAQSYRNEMIEKYQLDPESSLDEISDFLKSELNKMNKKEVSQNEETQTQTVETEESYTVPEHRTQSAL